MVLITMTDPMPWVPQTDPRRRREGGKLNLCCLVEPAWFPLVPVGKLSQPSVLSRGQGEILAPEFEGVICHIGWATEDPAVTGLKYESILLGY